MPINEDNTQTAQRVSQNGGNKITVTDTDAVHQAVTETHAQQQNGGNADEATITVECQEDASRYYKYPDVGTALSLNSIREVVDLIEQGVPPNFVPGLVSRLTQASAQVIAWLVREEEN